MPSSLRALRAANTAADSLSRTNPNDTNVPSIDDLSHRMAIEAFQLLLDSQRKELAEKDAALAALNKREITVSTIAIEKLTDLPTFKSVDSWNLHFTINEHLKVLENIAVESRQAIEYEANMRGLPFGGEWTTLSKPDILFIIKACFPQRTGALVYSTDRKDEGISTLVFPRREGRAQIYPIFNQLLRFLP